MPSNQYFIFSLFQSNLFISIKFIYFNSSHIKFLSKLVILVVKEEIMESHKKHITFQTINYFHSILFNEKLYNKRVGNE